jgi:phosphatidylserine decarboxylase
MIRNVIARVSRSDRVNFLLTNCFPRRLATSFIGWFVRIEQPLVRDLSLRVWRLFSDLDLSDAADTRFASLHACFTRRLRDGARPFVADPAIVASPCDAIVGACGTVTDGTLLQVKGSSYRLGDLLDDQAHARSLEGGSYVTLRLTASMYHRFHAPHDCIVTAVTHIFGDVWNVNPPTLRRVRELYTRNERAVLRTTLSATGHAITLVPVAAVLVAGIRLGFLAMPTGPARRTRWSTSCHAALRKGEEMGWFEHGSTIVVVASGGMSVCAGITEGSTVRAGQALFRIQQSVAGDGAEQIVTSATGYASTTTAPAFPAPTPRQSA